jgi:DNA-binding IclR family transcriptional regulator
MAPNNRSSELAGDPLAAQKQGGPKFKSVRRVFRIIDLVSQRGEELTAKELAREVRTNLSSCYYLLNVLLEEGYIEKIPRSGGYRIGSAVAMLGESIRSDFDAKIEPIVDELSRRAQRQTYVAVLSSGEMEVAQVKVPPRSPPVGVVAGFHGASHALALGKVLLAGMGSEYVNGYIDDHGLEVFTPRTIVQPAQLHAHLNKVRMVGVALDFEEFAQNLCCVAAPVESERGEVEGAIGLSTTTSRIRSESQQLVEMVRWAAEEASALLRK